MTLPLSAFTEAEEADEAGGLMSDQSSPIRGQQDEKATERAPLAIALHRMPDSTHLQTYNSTHTHMMDSTQTHHYMCLAVLNYRSTTVLVRTCSTVLTLTIKCALQMCDNTLIHTEQY